MPTTRVPAEHLALGARILGVAPDAWATTLDDALASVAPDAPEWDRLAALARAYTRISPHAAPLPAGPTVTCPACGGSAAPWLRRADHPAAYARCAACLHAVWLGPAPPASVYDAPYFAARSAAGVGYDAYAGERAYRESKADALLDRVLPPDTRTLLEVGSAFGYLRARAEARGLTTTGVDASAAAVAAARETYGFSTVHGTLADALGAGVDEGAFDVVVYQFVLEHVADPEAELRLARRALRAGGSLVLVVPSAEAREIEVFGASYRSLRPDHLHLFSRRSLAHFLARSGYVVRLMDSHCNLHLLLGALDRDELDALYARGEGPDLVVVAEAVS